MNNQDMITSIIASPPQPAEQQAKLCPMCGTLNHPLSRECFNCAWRGAFPGGAAVLLQAELRDKPQTRFLSLWRQRLRAKFFKSGS